MIKKMLVAYSENKSVCFHAESSALSRRIQTDNLILSARHVLTLH